MPCYPSSCWILRDGVVLGKGGRRLRQQPFAYQLCKHSSILTMIWPYQRVLISELPTAATSASLLPSLCLQPLCRFCCLPSPSPSKCCPLRLPFKNRAVAEPGLKEKARSQFCFSSHGTLSKSLCLSRSCFLICKMG